MKRAVIIFSIAFFVSCNVTNDSQDEALTFKTDQNNYSLGSTVTAILENDSDQAINYNLCFSKLELKQNKDWKFVGPSITCQAIARTLQSGEKTQYRITLNDSLKLSLGEYRITTNVGFENSTKSKTLSTQPFDVNGIIQLDS